jgi:prophage tail gpP-like protein
LPQGLDLAALEHVRQIVYAAIQAMVHLTLDVSMEFVGRLVEIDRRIAAQQPTPSLSAAETAYFLSDCSARLSSCNAVSMPSIALTRCPPYSPAECPNAIFGVLKHVHGVADFGVR